MKLKEKSKILKRAAYVALPHSLPILAGYGFLGLAYGILMSVNGFSPLFTTMMSLLVFGGSVQIVAVELMTAPSLPCTALLSPLCFAQDISFTVFQCLKNTEISA